MTVHHQLKEDLIEENKVEEIEKIVLKKLLMDQQTNQMLQMQAYSTLKKNKFTKKKLSPANENLNMLYDPQEERLRKAEYKREKMMKSVKHLIEMQNTSGSSGGGYDQYSMLISGIAGTQIIPNYTPAPPLSTVPI